MSNVVKLDDNRRTSVNGKPFFLIGARHVPEGGTPKILAEAGFNAYRTLTFGHDVSGADPLPAGDEGIMFWSYLYDRVALNRSADYRRQLEEHVRRVKDHPAFLCYENANEPWCCWKKEEARIAADELAEGTARLRELDPNHPIWLAHGCDRMVETLAQYNTCADILGCNPYPVAPPGIRAHVGVRRDGRIVDCPDQSIHCVGKYTEKMRRVSRGQMPVWMLVQGMANENWFNPKHTPELAGQSLDESKILYPSGQQMRFMAFDAIISGATGVAFALWKTPVDSPAWEHIKRVVAELRRLHDALAAGSLPGPVEVKYTDLGFTIWDGVRTLARRQGDEVYLFAANTAFDPAQVRIWVPGVMGDGTAVVEGEDRQIGLRAGAFSDDFEPFGVHVYRMPVDPVQYVSLS